MKKHLLAVLFLAFGIPVASRAQSILRRIPLGAYHVAADPTSGLLYATVPGASGQSGTLLAIDTASGVTVGATPIGNTPDPLAVSDDGKYVYVGLDGNATVQTYNAQSHTLGAAFTLGKDPTWANYDIGLYADDIQVMPGHDQTIAVARRNAYHSPRAEGVAIYDNGVMRPAATSQFPYVNHIRFNETGSAICGLSDESSPAFLTPISVNSTGARAGSSSFNLIPDSPTRLSYVEGKAYLNDGLVVDPVAQRILGKFVFSPAYSSFTVGLPDTKNRLMYFLQTFNPGGANNSKIYLNAYNLDTYAMVNSTLIYAGNELGSDLVQISPTELGIYARPYGYYNGTGDFFVISVTPEPSGLALMCGGCGLGFACLRRRKARNARDRMWNRPAS